MRARPINPPWEYLRQASLPALQSFELSRLNHAANLRKEIDLLFDQYFDETAAALLARFLIEKMCVPHSAVRGRPRQELDGVSAADLPRLIARARAR